MSIYWGDSNVFREKRSHLRGTQGWNLQHWATNWMLEVKHREESKAPIGLGGAIHRIRT